jgi:hypothetical protein
LKQSVEVSKLMGVGEGIQLRRNSEGRSLTWRYIHS